MIAKPARAATSFCALIGVLTLAAPLRAAPALPDYTPWKTLLARHLDQGAPDGIARLRYADVTPSERRSLEAFLDALQKEKPSTFPHSARSAFWINLYNARTVAVVLEHFPLASVLDIKIPGSQKAGPWDAKLISVEGRALSLNDVETDLRALKDPRIHFALNCASLGCPDLAGAPYTSETLDAMLDAGARRFIASPRGAEIQNDTLKLSSLFDWYKGDFGKTDRDVLGFLARYADPAKAKRLRGFTGKIVYAYDWRLNAASK